MNHTIVLLLALVLPAVASASSPRRYSVSGLVLSVDLPHQTVVVSHDRIPGYMEAMAMPYRVRDRKALAKLTPGARIDFSLVVTGASSYISELRVREYDSSERDPSQARRLKALDVAMRAKADSPVALERGQVVPDFALVDQNNRHVALSDFKGKVVAITFIYTRCPLPDYCFRLSNNFARIQKRFKERMGKELVLLSVTFDPEHDRPEVLAKYAAIWKANVDGWRFLTGPLPKVKEMCNAFGMNFWPDEGLVTHSLHTAVVDGERKLVANLEGNQFTADQLGDLVQATLSRGSVQSRVR